MIFQSLDTAQFARNPALRMVAYAIVTLLISVVHVVFLRFVSVVSVTPDLLLIVTVWIALAEGQFVGMFAGFLCGLLFDAYSNDVLGTNALGKTIAGFIAGYFYREGSTREIIGSIRFLVIVTVAGAVHNVIYQFLYVRPMQISFWEFFLKYGIATTLYTTVAAVFPMLVMSRKREW
jgi:rod shape-determining protein MreD